MNLQQDLIAEAQRLGFFLTGITSPLPPAHFELYEAWLEGGHHAAMEYLARPRARQCRADPHLILPEVRSIVCLGWPYPAAEFPPEANAPLTGRVARYAWGPDYHTTIPPRLEKLVAWTESRLGRRVAWRGYTDTGPILERDLARQAGLGWVGRNTCLIAPRIGSFFFLAEILWDVEVEPTPPLIQDHCGTCQRCIAACPTGCIRPDRTLDARRCIAYLTIEHKGSIPLELRPSLGNWIFGCDICQQVCPWNRRFGGGEGTLPAPLGERATPYLPAELQLSPQSFKQKFKSSPILRARRRGYLRNVAVALGNTRDPAAVPALAEALLHEPEPLVRAHSAWALRQIGGSPARTALEHARRQEEDPEVQAEIER